MFGETPRVAAVAVDDKARAAARIGGEHLLRSIRILTELSDGEVLSALISLAIVQANVAHLDREPSGNLYGDLQTIPPDRVRRPVSVHALAQSLGLPYETTRRHVERMRKQGRCQRVPGGVVVPQAALESELHERGLVEHLASLRRLFRELNAAGVTLG